MNSTCGRLPSRPATLAELSALPPWRSRAGGSPRRAADLHRDHVRPPARYGLPTAAARAELLLLHALLNEPQLRRDQRLRRRPSRRPTARRRSRPSSRAAATAPATKASGNSRSARRRGGGCCSSSRRTWRAGAGGGAVGVVAELESVAPATWSLAELRAPATPSSPPSAWAADPRAARPPRWSSSANARRRGRRARRAAAPGRGGRRRGRGGARRRDAAAAALHRRHRPRQHRQRLVGVRKALDLAAVRAAMPPTAGPTEDCARSRMSSRRRRRSCGRWRMQSRVGDGPRARHAGQCERSQVMFNSAVCRACAIWAAIRAIAPDGSSAVDRSLRSPSSDTDATLVPPAPSAMTLMWRPRAGSASARLGDLEERLWRRGSVVRGVGRRRRAPALRLLEKPLGAVDVLACPRREGIDRIGHRRRRPHRRPRRAVADLGAAEEGDRDVLRTRDRPLKRGAAGGVALVPAGAV